jgi:hypothetical protein
MVPPTCEIQNRDETGPLRTSGRAGQLIAVDASGVNAHGCERIDVLIERLGARC